MKLPISYSLRSIEAKVQKGDIRNTILRQVKVIQKTIKKLEQGRAIKRDEIVEYKAKKPSKARKLKNQVGIITQGLKYLSEALKELQDYKHTSVGEL
jgi:TPP-dependent indolepyruvate ferredoxin oxidoreductase alpha subunit